MIDSYCFSPDWLHEKRKIYGKADPSIMEKVIYALYLLQQLRLSELKFVFKGGTSLLLLLPEPARFSIDIDIIVPPDMNKDTIETSLNRIKEDKIFTDIVLDERRSYNGKIPKAHYRFVYSSQYSGKPQEILLDILFEEIHYPTCIERPLNCEWIRLKADAISITTPDVNSIAGDKLTAFAPTTIGVPYGLEKEREIIKQLFDVGLLYHLIDDVEIFKSSYQRISKVEIGYRDDASLSTENVIDDTIATALILARRENQLSADDKLKFEELMNGIKQFGYFVYNGSFRIDEAILASAKAALLAAAIKVNYAGTLPRFDPKLPIESFLINHPDYSFLNKKLRNVRGGALFYWSETVKLLTAVT